MKSKAEQHMQRVRELGCLVCGRPASAHHIREERVRNDYLTVPLCPEHHQGKLSIHADKRQFEALFGSELDLLAETIKRLGYGDKKH